jgi:hypothetical protein
MITEIGVVGGNDARETIRTQVVGIGALSGGMVEVIAVNTYGAMG